jgi:hypothetical protein
MPRGQTSGATKALIDAVAARGVTVSAYQIERWRAAGELPRVTRRGLGRGRGTAAEPPDEPTIHLATMLADQSRQGSPRIGGHLLERFARGMPVPEGAVRAALIAQIDAVARSVRADLPDDDAGWEARHELAARHAGSIIGVGWQDLIDAIDDAPSRAEPTPDQRRRFAAAIVQIFTDPDSAVDEDLAELVAFSAPADGDSAQSLLRYTHESQLRGENPWTPMRLLSIESLRRLASDAEIENLQRSLATLLEVTAWVPLIVMLGVLDIAGHAAELAPELARFNGKLLRRLQEDPMWPVASMLATGLRPRTRIQKLAVGGLLLLAHPAILGQWEQFHALLNRLVAEPAPPGTTGIDDGRLEGSQAPRTA